MDEAVKVNRQFFHVRGHLSMTMAAAVQGIHSSASSNCQQASSSTAPVLEFLCLFTRDLRRKQKRWQDGRLKFHTFNQRIMVYDDRGNFVGDAHWHEDYDFAEGEEVELERGGVIVQVAECMGSRDQDLSELVDKRAREKAERQSAAMARRTLASEVDVPNGVVPHFQLRHKPLHHLIGTPTGHHGRALIPTESPYEERQKLAVSPLNDSPRPAKRRKREVSPPSKSGYAQSLFGTALTLSGMPASTPPIRRGPLKTTTFLVEPLPSSDLDHDINSDSVPRTTSGQCKSTSGIRRSGLTRKGEIGSHLGESDPLRPVSVDLYSNDAEVEEVEEASPTRPRTKRGSLREASSMAASKPEIIRKPQSASTFEAPVGNEGSSAEYRRNSTAKEFGPVEGQHVSEGQPISNSRTELRIRPRKKRGLLMLSENLNSHSSRTTKVTVNRKSPPTSSPDTIVRDRDSGGLQRSHLNPVCLVKGSEARSSSMVRADLPTKTETGNKRDEYAWETLQGVPEIEETEDALVPSNYLTETGLPGKIKPGRQHNEAVDWRTTLLDIGCGDHILGETPGSSKSMKRKKSTPTLERANPRLVAEKADEEEQGLSDDSCSIVGGVPAPRLAKLGRRSIRSKEVIGFISDEDIDLGADDGIDYGTTLLQSDDRGQDNGNSFTTDFPARKLRVQPAAPMTTDVTATSRDLITTTNRLATLETGTMNADAASESIRGRGIATSNSGTTSHLPQRQTSPELDRVNVDLDMQVQELDKAILAQQQPANLLANPATRGKKAAKPSDAAGQVPENPLPSEAVLGKASGSGEPERSRQRSTKGNRAKEVPITPMLGFTRANGGPWSKEAYDLFEFTRPP
ncbi:hypothetical protein GGR54DRAFT_603263 [Hypoxylon sp. NC1633]|nr:hypothetical protein GGR54DRAFT_603263 [Hypoxylon sp. NC1633]